MALLHKYKRIFIGVLIGAIGGYIYWHEIGCLTRTCSITSSPINATLYGGLIGGLIANIFQKEEKNPI